MTKRQLNRINNIIGILTAAVTGQSDWCKLRHSRFDINTPLDCNSASWAVGKALSLYKKIPSRILGGRKELYMEYLEHPCVWNVHYTISWLSACIADAEEIESILDWEEARGIGHSLREAD